MHQTFEFICERSIINTILYFLIFISYLYFSDIYSLLSSCKMINHLFFIYVEFQFNVIQLKEEAEKKNKSC